MKNTEEKSYKNTTRNSIPMENTKDYSGIPWRERLF